jgi:hypothetical protein
VRHQKRSLHLHVYGAVKLRLRQLEDGRCLLASTRVDQDVEPVKFGEGEVGQPLSTLSRVHPDGQAGCPPSPTADLVHDFGNGLWVGAVDDDRGALVREAERNALPPALGRSDDNADLALEP